MPLGIRVVMSEQSTIEKHASPSSRGIMLLELGGPSVAPICKHIRRYEPHLFRFQYYFQLFLNTRVLLHFLPQPEIPVFEVAIHPVRPLASPPLAPFPPVTTPPPNSRHQHRSLRHLEAQLQYIKDSEHTDQAQPPSRITAKRVKKAVSHGVRTWLFGIDTCKETLPGRHPPDDGDEEGSEHDSRLVMSLDDPVAQNRGQQCVT